MAADGDGGSAHFYTVYGMELTSAVPLPELIAGGAGADVAVTLGRVDHHPPEPNKVRLVRGDVVIRFEDVGTFRLRGGREIRLDPVDAPDAALLRMVVTGPIMGLILHQRRVLALHASTVEIDGRAVAFVGATGSGKSTLAAAFEWHGHPLVADDVLALEPLDGTFVAQAGYPQLKLSPDVFASLGGDVGSLRPLHPALEKKARITGERFSAAARPLTRVYSLATGPSLGFEELSGSEAAIELLRNAYVAQVPSLAREPWLLASCAALAEAVRVTRLTRPSALTLLPEVVGAVRDDLSAVAAAEM